MVIEETQKKLETISEDVTKRRKELGQNLSTVDRCISDIMHAIELNSFDVVTGYKYAKQLQKFRHERRRIKNELLYLNEVYKHLSPKVIAITKKLTDRTHLKYKPRELDIKIKNNAKVEEI